MTYKMFSEERKAGQKKKKKKMTQGFGIKYFYSNTSYGLEKTASINYVLKYS